VNRLWGITACLRAEICCNDKWPKNNKSCGLDITANVREDLQQVMEKASAVTRTLDNNKHLRQLSLARSWKQFFANITLILTYGLEQIWEHITDSYLTISKYVMVECLKQCCLCSFMVPQLVHTLAGEAFQIRELKNELMLPSAATFTDLLNKSW